MGEIFEGKYEIFGDDPEEWQKSMDPDHDGKPGLALKGKWLRKLPESVRKVPREEEKDEVVKFILGYSVWFLVNYGSSLISLVCGLCGTVFGAAVKVRTGITQKKIPFL